MLRWRSDQRIAAQAQPVVYLCSHAQVSVTFSPFQALEATQECQNLEARGSVERNP